MRSRASAILAFALAATLPDAAFAQSKDGKAAQPPDSQARARDLYRQGSEAYQSGDNSRAVRLLREAWALRRTYDVAGTLAQAELDLGLYRDAAEHLEFCVRNFPLHESQEENDSIRAELDRLRARLARVQLRVIPDGADVLVNGKVVGKSPLDMPIYLEPGTHMLGARLDARGTERQLKTEAGLEQSVELRVDDSAPAGATASSVSLPGPGASIGGGPSSSVQAAAADTGQKTAGNYTPSIIVAGVGVAAIVTGIGLTLAANSDDDEREKVLGPLPGKNPCGAGSLRTYECRKINNLADSAQTYRVASYASFGVALAAGVGAVLLWPASKQESSATVAPAAIQPSFAISSTGIEAKIGGVF